MADTSDGSVQEHAESGVTPAVGAFLSCVVHVARIWRSGGSARRSLTPADRRWPRRGPQWSRGGSESGCKPNLRSIGSAPGRSRSCLGTVPEVGPGSPEPGQLSASAVRESRPPDIASGSAEERGLLPRTAPKVLDGPTARAGNIPARELRIITSLPNNEPVSDDNAWLAPRHSG